MDATSLPQTCGEATEIPGTPSVGCVAVLQYAMDTVAGFSCCVVASKEEVFILGPDLNLHDGSLISVKLWRPYEEEKVARMTSLVSFLVYPVDHEPPNVPRKQNDTLRNDEVCAIVAWEDCESQQQHITGLFFSLTKALSASVSFPVRACETSFYRERNQQRVLRLFYHPLFSEESSKGKHVVLCSCYDKTVRKDACLTLGKERNRHILTPGDPRGILLGVYSFVLCSAVKTNDASPWEVMWVPKSPAWIAPWIMQSPNEGVVCSLAVREEENTSIVAAVGTTNGRLVLLHSNGKHDSHRFGGPIADLAFVDTQSIKEDKMYRSAAITELINEQKKKKSSKLNMTSESEAGNDAPKSLVILDSVGRVVVLRDLTIGSLNMQVVPDVQQFITLAKHRVPNPNAGSVTEESASTRPVVINSKSFFGISSLRQFFHRERPKEVEIGLRKNKLTPSISAEEVDPIIQPGHEKGMCAGHILSRGLLNLASLPGPRGHVELVVSTMSQFIVSIPFHPKKGVFSISGFIEAPEAMFFIGFVDFFNTGVKEMVMAGMHHVLVARRSRRQQKIRAALLLRLLSKQKDPNTTHSDELLAD